MAAASLMTLVHSIPLRKDYSHDVHADGGGGFERRLHLRSATRIIPPEPRPRAGISPGCCSTSRGIRSWWVDEAYIHYSDAETVLDYALDDSDLIVLRSFSEIYGLAGLRIGFAAGRPDLLARLQRYGMNPLSLPGVGGGAGEPGAEGAGAHAEARQCAAARRYDRVDTKAGVRRSAFADKLLHGGCAEARTGLCQGDGEEERLCRTHMADHAASCARHGGNRG